MDSPAGRGSTYRRRIGSGSRCAVRALRPAEARRIRAGRSWPPGGGSYRLSRTRLRVKSSVSTIGGLTVEIGVVERAGLEEGTHGRCVAGRSNDA